MAGRVGRSKAVKLLPVAALALTAKTAASMVIDYSQLGWEETLAQALNEELALDDIELAREFVRAQISGSYIAGGTPRLSIPLNSSQNLPLFARFYRVRFSGGNVASVWAYSVVEIKVFPDGKRTVAVMREDSPDDIEYLDNPKWWVDDYWPAVGDDAALFDAALRNAMWKADN